MNVIPPASPVEPRQGTSYTVPSTVVILFTQPAPQFMGLAATVDSKRGNNGSHTSYRCNTRNS